MLVVYGAPRTKKNSADIWKAGDRTILRPSEAWMAWRDAAAAQALREGWRRTPALAVPCACRALFYRAARIGDAVGYYQGLADVLEELGVVTNDRLIAHWDGSRLLADRRAPRVELTLTPLGAP